MTGSTRCGSRTARREATVEFGIDTSPPSASIATPHDGAILFIGDKYTADYTCTDGGAGLAATGGCVGTLADGAAIPTLRLPGTYTFKVTATDVYGRSSVATSSYVLVRASRSCRRRSAGRC